MEQNNNIGTNDPIVVSIIAYMTIVGWLIAVLVLNSQRHALVNFHIRQALGIYLLLIASGLAFLVPVLGWIAGVAGYLLVAILWVLGLLSAIKGVQSEVPFLGDKFQEWFQGL